MSKKRRTRRSDGRSPAPAPSAARPASAPGAATPPNQTPTKPGVAVGRSAATRRGSTATARRRRSQPPPSRFPSLRTVLIAAAAIVAVGFVGMAFIADASAADYTCGEQVPAAAAPPPDGAQQPSMGNAHPPVGTTIEYASCPPTSGPHYNARGAGPIAPRFYGPGDQAEPNGWVHNLEHGYLVALYRCQDDVCPSEDVLQQLRQLATDAPQTESAAACGYRTKTVVARFDQMSAPFALLTWERLLLLDEFDLDEAIAFGGRWMEQAAPEANAC